MGGLYGGGDPRTANWEGIKVVDIANAPDRFHGRSTSRNTPIDGGAGHIII